MERFNLRLESKASPREIKIPLTEIRIHGLPWITITLKKMNNEHALKLLEKFAETLGVPIDKYGSTVMSNAIDDPDVDISPRYLTDLYKRLTDEQEKGIPTKGPRAVYINAIAKHLGYTGFHQFSLSLEQKISPSLASCVGYWWSYVRANSGNYIYAAPVHIFEDKMKKVMRLEMKGRERVFSGRVEEKAGCLSGFLESGTDKRLGLVFKMGDTRLMNVLQGVFCGMSTAGCPIAGREILVREKLLDYTEMHWTKYHFDGTLDTHIQDYFSGTGQDNIVIRDIRGFELEDLPQASGPIS